VARGFAISLITFALASASLLVAPARAQTYPPDGPNIPVIANSEDPSGAFGQDLQAPPPPKGWDEESAWNMKVEGFNDNQGRPVYQPLVVDQDGRQILYLGNLTGQLLNPFTGKVEPNGTSIIDVTDVKNTRYLFHIPGPPGPVGNAGAQMVRVCSGSVLPHGEKGKWYLLRAYGNVGPDEAHQIWDVTDPAKPTLLTTIVSGLSNTHKNWWADETWEYRGADPSGGYRLHVEFGDNGVVHLVAKIPDIVPGGKAIDARIAPGKPDKNMQM
jgi:hypothetical protein